VKEGRLPAVCAHGLARDGHRHGRVDLVCQVASPGNVARALQRVGRAGHIVGQKSKGRFIPRTLADLLEQAVLVREMVAGRVEEIRVPVNCLDILLQPGEAVLLHRCEHQFAKERSNGGTEPVAAPPPSPARRGSWRSALGGRDDEHGPASIFSSRQALVPSKKVSPTRRS